MINPTPSTSSPPVPKLAVDQNEIRHEKNEPQRSRSSPRINLITSLTHLIKNTSEESQITHQPLTSPRDSSAEDCSNSHLLSPKSLGFLNEIKKKLNSPFGFPTLKTIHSAMEQYCEQNICAMLNDLQAEEDEEKPIESESSTVVQKLLNQLKSNDSPAVILCKLHLNEFESRIIPNDSFRYQLKKILNALITNNCCCFSDISLSMDAQPLDLILEFFDYFKSRNTGAALSYIIFGTEEEKLGSLSDKLRQWMNPTYLQQMVDRIQRNEFHEFIFPEDYSFKVEDIKRTFIGQEGELLPNSIMINHIPLKLEKLGVNRADSLTIFFKDLLTKIYQAGLNSETNEDLIESVLNNFIEKELLPESLCHLLGFGSIGSRLLGIEFVRSKFSILNRESKFCNRVNHGTVDIFFNIQPNSISCSAPITLTLYHKLSNEPESFAYDNTKPLAEILFSWVSCLDVPNKKQISPYQTFLGVQSCTFLTKPSKNASKIQRMNKYHATKSEQEEILQSLGLPRKRKTSLGGFNPLNLIKIGSYHSKESSSSSSSSTPPKPHRLFPHVKISKSEEIKLTPLIE